MNRLTQARRAEDKEAYSVIRDGQRKPRIMLRIIRATELDEFSFMKKGLLWIALAVAGFIGIYIAVCYVVYRVPAEGEPEYFEGRIVYKPNEQTGLNRRIFEEMVMGNRAVRLDDESIWYVSKRDYKILWPRTPEEMRSKGYTIKTELKAQKLFFGGYSQAEIYELEILNEPPAIIE